MSDRLDQLEYTVMELGAEIFRLRQEVGELNTKNDNFTKVIFRLKEILNDKGFAEADDIEGDLGLEQVLNQLAEGGDPEADDEEMAKPKSCLH